MSSPLHGQAGMRIVSVSASSKKAGKSTFASFLVKELDAECGLKVSSGGSHGRRNPIESDPDILATPGTDTGCLIEAGASHVLWVNARGHRLKRAIRSALKRLPAVCTVVIEGNAALEFIEPDMAVFLMAVPFDEFKPSAAAALEKAQVVLVDRSGPLGDMERLALKREIRTRARSASIIFSRDDEGRRLAWEEALRLTRKRLDE